MKSLVIYFSQTGNTKTIAQAIGRGIESEGASCEVRRIKDVKPEDWLNYDLIGIGSCVWSSSPIPNVIWHIKALPEEVKGKHAFFFCTHGVLPGRCIIRGVQPMKDKGLTVLGWRDWYTDASLPGHGKPWFTDGHPDEIDIAEAEAFGAAMVRHSIKVSNGSTAIIPELPTPEMCDKLYGIGHPFLFGEMPKPAVPEEPKEPEPYIMPYPTSQAYVAELEGVPNESGGPSTPMYIDPEKCIDCKRCAQACWCENIDGSTTPPTIRSQNCERCNFCEGVCPTGAFVVDFSPPKNIDPDKMLQGQRGSMGIALDIAEAQGRFRRLLREEDVGFTTPWETVTSHPRHKEIP